VADSTMNTIHLVRPELQAFVRDNPIPQMTAERLAIIREAPTIAYPPPPEAPVTVEERTIQGPDGQHLRLLVYRPIEHGGPLPAILHVHGGGMVVGQPEMSDPENRLLSAALPAVIVSVDYRLAPEHPFPAPLEDCYSALAWLNDQAAALSVDTTRIVIKGESAGGGIAAGLALLARDRGEVPVVFQCLTYPMIDDRPPADPHPLTGEFVWSAASNRFGWACYLGEEPGGPNVSPYAAPARAIDLAGLPATLIIVPTLDIFLEEDLEYTRRLTRAGVPVELIVYPGAYHGFHMAGDTELHRRYTRDVLTALKAAVGHD